MWLSLLIRNENWNRRIAIPPRLEMIYRLKSNGNYYRNRKKFELLKWFKYDFEISNIIWLRTLLRHDSIYWSNWKMLLTIRRDSHPKDVQIIVHLGIQPKRRRQIISVQLIIKCLDIAVFAYWFWSEIDNDFISDVISLRMLNWSK